jgi:RecG-like helicase
VLGTAQSGLSGVEFTELLADMRLIHRANREATAILEKDPELALPEHAPLRALVQYDEESRITC